MNPVSPIRAGAQLRATPASAKILPLVASAREGDRSVGDHPTVGGNQARLLIDTAQFVPAVLRDINQARDHVNITMFSFQDDGAGKSIGDALKQKAREGVEVNLIIDGFGSRQWPMSRYRAHIEDLKRAGVNVQRNWRWNLPFIPDNNSGVRAIDHRKIFEVDGKVAYLGGMNLSKQFDEWHDTMVRIQGPAAAVAGAEIAGRWVDTGGAMSDRRVQTLAMGAADSARSGAATVQILGNSPRGALEATDEFFRMARSATQRFWVLTPFIGNHEMVDELVAAAKRGVDVRVAVPGPNPWKNGKFARPLTQSFYPELAQGGVRIYEQPQMSHAKLWLSDDTANISSVNLDHHSASMDYEIGATVHDPTFRTQVEQLFSRDFARSRVITADEAASHANLTRIREALGIRV